MTATTTSSKSSHTNSNQQTEADSQYHAQVDVITQLAARVDVQLATAKRQETGAVRTALIKLEGDFRRVKDRVAALQASVSKMRAQSAALKAAQQQQAAGDATEESMGYEEFQRHMELQLQQDVSFLLFLLSACFFVCAGFITPCVDLLWSREIEIVCNETERTRLGIAC